MSRNASTPPTGRKLDPLIYLGILWLCVIGGGLVILWNYQTTPGDPGSPPPRWPIGGRLSRVNELPTLIVFLHPRCPCSRASLDEFAWVMARARGKVTAHVVFFNPDPTADGRKGTDLWDSASRIPGANVFFDADGLEAQRFRAVTSGLALLYDAKGRLAFSGGITASRGHSGENEGRNALVALLVEGVSGRLTNAVFGCSFIDGKF